MKGINEAHLTGVKKLSTQIHIATLGTQINTVPFTATDKWGE